MRIGAVSYLNTKPLVYGLTELAPQHELVFDLPSRLADDLAAGRLVRILEDYESPASPLQAVFPSARHLAPKTRAFLDFLGAELRVAAAGLGMP